MRSYQLPLEMECEFTLLESTQRGDTIAIMAGSPGAAENMVPDQRIQLAIDGAATRQKRCQAKLFIYQYSGDEHNPRTIGSHEGFELSVGEPNRLRIAMGRESWKITLNDETFTIAGVKPKFEQTVLELWHWQPLSRWLVRNVAIHSQADRPR